VPVLEIPIGLITYGISLLAYFGLSMLLLVSWKDRGPGTWLILASVCTFLWALVNVSVYLWPATAILFASLAETLRSAGWIIFLASFLVQYWKSVGKLHYAGLAPALVTVALVLAFSLDMLQAFGNLRILPFYPVISKMIMLERLAFAVAGVFLVDNFFRNTALHNRWSIRFLCLGLGGIFAFDFLFYADAVLSKNFSASMYEARGAINAFIVPLIAISAARNPGWSLDVFVSRGVVLHSASLIASGTYLVIMGIAGFYLHDLGGRWGSILQVTFWFGAVLLLLVTVFSGQFRARLRVLVNKHFFNYKYDYREEWLRFIQTLSSSNYAEGLRPRVIKAMADIVDSPGGALWMAEEPAWFSQVAVWNFHAAVKGVEQRSGEFCEFLERTSWIIDLDDVDSETGLFEDCHIPQWLRADPRAWLIVPLIHHGRLSGFILLERPLATKDLNWEDFDLFKTLGIQVASYLAEQDTEMALAEARQFEAFNQRFAFIMHDIKNLVSQLSLLATNADKHAGNPEFQKDMVLTVKESVGRMNQLLTRLNDLSVTTTTNRQEVELSELVRNLVEGLKKQNPALASHMPLGEVFVEADAVQLENIFSHVIQNALDAVSGLQGRAGKVNLEFLPDDGFVLISIEDNGAGMSQEFMRDGLFKPFKSTKETGYGIGAYESRQLVKSFGGNMGVESELGKGTIVTIRLPSLKKERAMEAQMVTGTVAETAGLR
jgi:putative PEP-CTERM system histidine kinase